MKLGEAMGRVEDIVSHEDVCTTCGVGPCECHHDSVSTKQNPVARAWEWLAIAVMSRYYRGLRRFIRFLIRTALWRRKESDEDDYLHAGKVMEYDRIPARSTKADGKRAALAYARVRTRDPRLTWGQARKRLKRWEREEREANARRRGPTQGGFHPAGGTVGEDARGARPSLAAAGVGNGA